MSRSGYSDDGDYINLYRGSVYSAIRGKRGQELLRELAVALDAMPIKELAPNSFQTDTGQYCTLGVLGAARKLDMTELERIARSEEDDYGFYTPMAAAKAFGIAKCMAAEIMFENDEAFIGETPAHRWARMRAWVSEHLTKS